MAWAMPQPSAWQAWPSTSRAISLPSAAASATILAVSWSSLPPAAVRQIGHDILLRHRRLSISRCRTASGRRALRRAGQRDEGCVTGSPMPRLQPAAMPQPLASDSTVSSGRSACRPGPQVADFGRARAVAAIDLLVDDQSAADAGADRDVQHDARARDPAPKRASASAATSQSFSIGRGSTSTLAAPVDQAQNPPSRRSDGSSIKRPAAESTGPPKPMPIAETLCRAISAGADASICRRMPVAPGLDRHRKSLGPPASVPSPGPTPNCSLVPPISIPRNIGDTRSCHGRRVSYKPRDSEPDREAVLAGVSRAGLHD